MRKHIVQTKLHEITAIPLEMTMIALSDVYHLIHISMAGGFDATNLTSVNWLGASISLHPRLSCHSLHTHTYTHTHHRHTNHDQFVLLGSGILAVAHSRTHTHEGIKPFISPIKMICHISSLKNFKRLVSPSNPQSIWAVGNLLWMQLILPFFKNKITHIRWYMTNLSYQFLMPFKITVQPDHSHVMGVTPIIPSG